jgi:hypothetical protein
MRISKRAATLVTALAATLAIGVPVAISAAGPGQTVKVNSTVTINAYGNGGKVKASNSNCLAGRRVIVKEKGHGKIGAATTNDKGAWKAEPKYTGALPFKIYAEVKPLTQATAGPIYRCLGATSRTVTISGG